MGRQLFYFLFFLLFLPTAYAQDRPRIHVSVNKDRVMLGEPLLLTIELRHISGSVGPLLQLDSIPHFEISGKPVIDSAADQPGKQGKAVYSLTSFDSGQWVIPPVVVAEGLQSTAIPVTVFFTDADPQQDYHDIKDILEAPAEKRRFAWWWYAAGALLLAALTWFIFRKKKVRPLEQPAPPAVSVYEEAMRLLAKLEKENPSRGDWHNRLTGIFRVYLFRRKGIQSLQRTTSDLVLQLHRAGTDRAQLERLAQALRLSDFVKFARYPSSAEEDRDCLLTVKEMIQYFENTETAAAPVN